MLYISNAQQFINLPIRKMLPVPPEKCATRKTCYKVNYYAFDITRIAKYLFFPLWPVLYDSSLLPGLPPLSVFFYQEVFESASRYAKDVVRVWDVVHHPLGRLYVYIVYYHFTCICISLPTSKHTCIHFHQSVRFKPPVVLGCAATHSHPLLIVAIQRCSSASVLVLAFIPVQEETRGEHEKVNDSK